MPTTLRLVAITLVFFIADSFAAKADALTFTYGGRETKLVSNDNSTTIQTWSVSSPYSAHMSDSGTVWYTTSSTTGGGGGMGGSSCNQGAAWGNIVELDWNGNTIRTITTAQLGGGTPHHAITLTDKGTVLAVVAETYNGTCGERLVEFDPQQNKVIWAWHTNDHEGSNSATKLKRGSSSNDPYHVNNVDLDTSSNRIVFSSHQVQEVFVINHAIDSTTAKGTSGDILWRIGKPSNYGASGGTQYADQAVHSARWVKPGYPGAGNIIFYANISPANSNYATGYEVTPTYSLSSSGEWQYKIVFSGTNNNSSFTNSGGIDKIFNGNWVVTYSNESYTAYEFDATVGATQTKASSVGTWTSAGQNGLHRYPVCGGRLLAGVKANDAEAIALYNAMACGNSSSSSEIGVSSSSSSSEMEYSSSSVTSAISPMVNKSNFQFKANHNQIYLNDLIPNSHVSIADIHGVVKFNGFIQASEYKLNTTSWATGVYFINIVQPNKTTNYHTVMVIH